MIKPILRKTPYELWKGKKPNIRYFHPFGCKCYVYNNGKKNLRKFDLRSDEGIFLGYTPSSQAYIVFNKYTVSVEELIHVVFYDTNPSMQLPDEKLPIKNTLTHVSINTTKSKESTKSSEKSTTYQNKIVISRWERLRKLSKWLHHWNLLEKLQTRASLKKQASIALVS